jgi:signal transduction histidine kinase
MGSYVLDINLGIWAGSIFLNEIFGIDANTNHSVEEWLAVIHPEDQVMMSIYFANDVFGKKGRFDKEYRIIPFNTKQEKWVHGIGELEFDKSGNPIKMIGTIRDITEQKKLTRELIEAKEHAEESDRLKSSFLANMSHEIRTPMNSIMGFASLLPEEESSELMCQYANIIVQNSEQLVSLIDGIVMYSKLQTGLFMYRPVLFLAHNLFTDIQQSFNLPAFQKGVTIKFVCEIDETTKIYSDYDKLRQIITNLTVNAFKYTHKGEITLGFDLKVDIFRFYIKDSGIGIPQKDMPHIFERFYRGSNIDEAKSRGTGLGLCIVKELVEMLGGTIWVESEVEKGSTFYFTIPAASNSEPILQQPI